MCVHQWQSLGRSPAVAASCSNARQLKSGSNATWSKLWSIEIPGWGTQQDLVQQFELVHVTHRKLSVENLGENMVTF